MTPVLFWSHFCSLLLQWLWSSYSNIYSKQHSPVRKIKPKDSTLIYDQFLFIMPPHLFFSSSSPVLCLIWNWSISRPNWHHSCPPPFSFFPCSYASYGEQHPKLSQYYCTTPSPSISFPNSAAPVFTSFFLLRVIAYNLCLRLGCKHCIFRRNLFGKITTGLLRVQAGSGERILKRFWDIGRWLPPTSTY